MIPEDLQRLVEHMGWADALVWSAVLELPSAQADTRMRELLHHVHLVQWAFLRIWRDEPLDLPDLSAFEDLRSINVWAHEYHREVPEYFATLDPEKLQRQIRFPWADELAERRDGAHPATLAETIFQITSHTTHHRGQVCARIRELGGVPPLIDFIAWIWLGKPAAEWEIS
jgi:uncharacterized damage-inducible protein DinB